MSSAIEPQLESNDVAAIEQLGAAYQRLCTELAKVIVGQNSVIEKLAIALFARGHSLVMGVPGLAKTLLVSRLAETLSLNFSRIQFTPDLSQRFTVLGNWENFVRDSTITDADLRRNPNKAERARAAREQALRRLRDSGSRTEERQDTSPGTRIRDGRAVVVLGNG